MLTALPQRGCRQVCRWPGACAGGCLCALGLAQPALAGPPETTTEQRAAEEVVPPALLAQVELVYPSAALETGEHGDVSLLVGVAR